MKRAKYNEVPKEYRRDYKKEFVELLKMFAICLIGVTFFMWLFITFG